MDNVKIVKAVFWDDYIECHFKLPKRLVEYYYKYSNLPKPRLWESLDEDTCEYAYMIGKVEPCEEFLKKFVETIEGICNQHDDGFLFNHLITRNGKIPAPADVHEMMHKEYGLCDINDEDAMESFDGEIEWYTAHFFIELNNLLYDPLVDEEAFLNEDESEDGDVEEDAMQSSSGEDLKPEEVDLDEKEPPQFLYHGTAPRNYGSIVVDGLVPKTSNYVHLTADYEEALEYGRKFGRPAVFVVRSGDMYKEGHKFYQTADGVWLTEKAPREYVAVKFEKIDFSKLKIDKIVIVDDARTFDPDNLPKDEK